MLEFKKLWRTYETMVAEHGMQPCDGPYNNQCALRMSITLETLGYSFARYTEPKCKHGHARGAESLASWLWRKHLRRPAIYEARTATVLVEGKPTKKKLSAGEVGKAAIKDKQGILFFKDCFTRSGQAYRSGDHIDLWDKGKTIGFDDPDNLSRALWFWEL